MASFDVPSLTIINQTSLGREKFSCNSILKDIHVVAKTLPFEITVAAPFPLSQAKFGAQLFYDNDNSTDYHRVDSIKQVPLTFRVTVPAETSEQPERVTFEIKLNALSSQHEDSLFRVQINVEFPLYAAALDIMSEPIKVVSKPSVISKARARKAAATSDSTPSVLGKRSIKPESSSPSSSEPSSPPQFTQTDPVVLECLARLEQQQILQQKMIAKLIEGNSNSYGLVQTKKESAAGESCSDHFETALVTFLDAFQRLPQSDRALKVRKTIFGASAIMNDRLTEFVQLCYPSPSRTPLQVEACGSLDNELPWDMFHDILDC
eukprot:TRINITY_DN4284_c0_g3_i2.p1 TRINITY_DN4284_c0_g3~~TRINITY_DN4284_c0_g3_i2.p1  ORF type:complete len:321 (+),score=70.43 TRINITY_DN4284_c0_g3_i2:222-1184(+)